jgi:hypothetical protein
MLRQPAFEAAEFHTEFLDELLQQRGDEGFSAIDPSLEEVAAIAACIADAEVDIGGRSERICPASDQRTAGPVLLDRPAAGWKGRARLEGLRG